MLPFIIVVYIVYMHTYYADFVVRFTVMLVYVRAVSWIARQFLNHTTVF